MNNEILNDSSVQPEDIDINNSNITAQLTFRTLVLLNMQKLTNFPYIEKDFDAVTDYQLLCTVVDYLNQVIQNSNEQNTSINNLYTAFLNLQTYVNNTKDEVETAFNELNDYVRDYFANLDVQEEINNKLEEMMEDGSLSSIIENYINPYLVTFNSRLNTQDNIIREQNAKIEAVESGSPLVASSTAGMTDTTRVYVNTTDGYWYYYNGTNWVSGGVYQSSEDSNQVKSNVNRINTLSGLLGTEITNDFEFTDGYQIVAESDDFYFGQSVSSNNFKDSDFVDISDYKILDIVAVVRKYTETSYTGLCFYDENEHVISGYYYTDNDVEQGYTINKRIEVPSYAKYIRTSLFKGDSTIGTNTIDFQCYGYKNKTSDEIDYTKEVLNNISKEIGYIDMKNIDFDVPAQITIDNGNAFPSNNYVCTDYIDCEGFNLIKLTMVVRAANPNAYTGIGFYDSNKTYISGKKYTDDSVETGYNALKEILIPTNAKYFRTTLFSENSTHGTNTLPFTCELYNRERVFKSIIYNDYEVIHVPNYPHHDATVIDNEIWAFNKPSDGNSKIYDLEFNLIKNINVNFTETFKDSSTASLEMKSVDYNNYNNVLLVGNGKATYSPNDSYIYAFYDAKSWKNISGEINFSNCGDYSKIDVSDLGVKSYGFWAGKTYDPDNSNASNEQIYVCTNLFKDIYLIQLGKGETQLDLGTYDYIDENKYNGTYRIIKHWQQEVLFTGDDGQHGGQAYNGKLYIANNNNTTNEIYEFMLCDDGKLKINTLQLMHYTSSGGKKYRYLDGMFIKDGYIYSAPLIIDDSYHTGTNKVVLKIKL